MFYLRSIDRSKNDGVALIIVLAFVVLVTGLVVAYLSRSTADRQIAQSSFNDSAADILAQSALQITVSSLKQEIVDGSTSSVGSYPYTPTNNADAVPQHSPLPVAGATPAIPNLIRRSTRSDAVPPPVISSRASPVNSVNDVSANGRSISFARWNSHYLVPKLLTGDDSTDPILGSPDFISPNYWAPDWVLVTRNGPAVETSIGSGTTALNSSAAANSNYVIGRYAYVIYDEGGLLDINVGGFPSGSSTNDIGRKGTLAFADLTALRTTASGFVTSTAVDKIVGWRNYATSQVGGTFPSLTFSATSISNFSTYFLDRTRDFRTAAAVVYNNRTDQAATSRTELIKLRSATGGSANMLQYLGTFSREVNHSTWGTSPKTLSARFPLERFDRFATTPPTVAVSADIQKYFGLLYVPASGPTAEHWQYVGTAPGSTTLLSVIPAVIGTNQDPDLFPLLQYALPSATMTEILSIGASLIDQRDENAETTWIEFADTDTTQPSHKAFGVDKNASTDPDAPPQPSPLLILNDGTNKWGSFRNVGELGYGYKNGSASIDFTSATNEAVLLDLFTYNTAPIRAGITNINTQNAGVLAAMLQTAILDKVGPTTLGQADPGSNKSKTAYNAAIAMITNTTNGTTLKPAIGRQDLPRLFSTTGTIIGTTEEAKETAARALGEITQARTWGLLIDVIAQSGHFPPNAATGPNTSNPLANFVVEGEKRYWLHVAIDRFTGEVVDQQLEAVYE